MGKPKQSIIELNGKRYDVRTGQVIGGASVDTATKPARASSPAPKARVVADIKRSSTQARGARRQAQRSQTLVRSGLKKPAAKAKAAAAKSRVVSDIRPVKKAQSPIRLGAKSDAERQVRAQKIEQSRLVRKFTDSSIKSKPVANKLPVTLAPMSVQPAPAAALPAHKPISLSNPIIERGLKNATSHTNTYKAPKKSKAKRKKSGKLAVYGASALAAVLLVGVVALQNKPKFDVWYASSRSGVEAHVPGYLPAGFAMGDLKYSQNQVEMSYQSNSDDRSFKITQTSSNLNSDSLRNVLGASDGEGAPQTIENKGRTIYLYGDSSAAWVSNGVRYEIDGNSQLTTSQIIDIVSSL